MLYYDSKVHITHPGRAARTTEKALLASFLFFFSLVVWYTECIRNLSTDATFCILNIHNKQERRMQDVEEMNGHFKMFNYMIKHTDEPLIDFFESEQKWYQEKVIPMIFDYDELQ